MKKLFVIFSILLLVSACGGGGRVLTNYEKGVEAYQSGNYSHALHWFRLEAGNGHVGAQNYLGVMYYRGKGIPQSYIHAFVWFNVASANGLASAEQSRDTVRKNLSPDLLVEAQRLSLQCINSYYADCN